MNALIRFNNAVKVKCTKCASVYWTEYNIDAVSVCCRSDLMEFMETQADYAWKRQLETN